MVNKIDSNFTGLRYTQESAIGVLPGSPIWYPLEPNSYNDFGTQLTTQARSIIQAGRQRKKGVVTDLEAKAGFASDFTQTNFYDMMQGFFFADWRAKADAAISAATGSTTDDYTVDSEAGFLPGHLVYVSGMTTTANNGLKLLDGVTTNALSVSTDLTTETDAGTVKAVGFQFGSVLSVNQVSVQETEYNIASLTAASRVLTITDFSAANGQTVSIGGVTYTFRTALSTGPTIANEVLIGGSVANMCINLNKAINDSGTEGTHYSVGTAANPKVSSVTNSTSTVTVTALIPGASGNAIVIGEALADGSWASDATLLTGGAGVGWVELGIIPGEWVYIGGDTAGLKFATAGNNGFVRARVVENARLIVDKTQGTTADEVAGALTVQVFFGDVIKNESNPDLIIRRSYQLERSLVSAGYEYVLGCIPNTLAFQIQTANKITCELSFLATDSQQVTSGSRKTGTFPAGAASLAAQADAFNTSSDFGRLRLATKTAYSTPLFAFLSELNLSINNNVSANKAVSVLGAFDLTAGDFVVEGSMTAYFADIDAVAAVRDNSDVTLDFSLVKNNAGWLFDIPLLTLGDGRLNVEKDQPIKIPLSMAAAADPTFDHTLLACSFTYLPDAAE